MLENKNYLPEYHKYLTFLKKVFRHEFRKNGFKRLTTTLFEDLEDLNKIYDEKFLKENVIKLDGKNKFLKQNPSLSNFLSYRNEELENHIQPVYMYYMDKFLENKKEKFYIGGDIIGETDPILEGILIYMSYSILNKIGLENKFKIRLNCVLNNKEIDKYLDELRNFYENKRHLLKEENIDLIQNNPLKLLTLKSEDELILAKEAPKAQKFLKKVGKEHFNKFLSYLDMLEIPYEIDNLVIGDDYCSNVVWEVVDLENENLISKGFRYDKMSELFLYKKPIGGVGFKFDIDYLIELLEKNSIKIKNKDIPDVYFVQLGDDAKKAVLGLSLEARERGIKTMVSIGTPAMKEQILKAQRSEAKYIVIVGFMEAKSGVFQVRDSENGTQEEVKKEELLDYIIDKIGKDNLDFYCPVKDLMID